MTDSEPGTDWGDLYLLNVDAVAALASGLTDDQLATVLPATPEWTVRQVLQHVAGGPADGVAGRMEGAPGPEWTARHVAEREGRSVEELVAELRQNAEAAAGFARSSPRPAVVWDLATHHADLHEGLGLGRPPERYWGPIAAYFADHVPHEVAQADPYELFRAVFSRRSRAQTAAWGTGAEQATLDAISVFGPRDDDQPQPSAT